MNHGLDLGSLISTLEKILRLPSSERLEEIQALQSLIWSADELSMPAGLEEVLRDLAFDLDFYEPDSSLRAEDPSYYGEDRLASEIRTALRHLKRARFSPISD